MNPLSLLSGLPVKFYEILGVVLALAAFGGYMYHRGGIGPRAERDAVQARFDAFSAQVKAIGDEAQKAADAKEKADKLAKEQADAENKRTTDMLQRTISQLRHDRDSAGAGQVPAAPANSNRPDLACFDRAAYQSAYGILVAGLRGLADEGTAATVDLNTAKTWAKSP